MIAEIIIHLHLTGTMKILISLLVLEISAVLASAIPEDSNMSAAPNTNEVESSKFVEIFRKHTAPRQADLKGKPWMARLKNPCKPYRKPSPQCCSCDDGSANVVGDLIEHKISTLEVLSLEGRETIVKIIFTAISSQIKEALASEVSEQ